MKTKYEIKAKMKVADWREIEQRKKIERDSGC